MALFFFEKSEMPLLAPCTLCSIADRPEFDMSPLRLLPATRRGFSDFEYTISSRWRTGFECPLAWPAHVVTSRSMAELEESKAHWEKTYNNLEKTGFA